VAHQIISSKGGGGGAWVVMGSFNGPVAGGDGRGGTTGTELTGICSSSSSEEIWSKWAGFSHRPCFSVLIQCFKVFIPSVKSTIRWNKSIEGATAGAVGGG